MFIVTNDDDKEIQDIVFIVRNNNDTEIQS